MSTATVNGQKRPNLSDQIDRLDTILDGLADGLNEAVAGVVRETVLLAVREAVTAVLSEVQNNPKLQAKLLANAAAPAAGTTDRAVESHRPSSWRRIWNRACGIVAVVGNTVCDATVTAYHSVTGWLGQGAGLVAKMACSAWNNRVIVTLAIGAGTLGGATCCFGGPFLAAGWAALSSTAAIVVARVVGVWDRFLVGTSFAA